MALETNTFCAGDEHFSAGDEHVENAWLIFSHTHIASYQQLPKRTYVEMNATHRYFPPKTGGSYHTLVLISEYATPTTEWSSSTLTKLIEKTIN